MEITEVRIKLMDGSVSPSERLQAFCSITLDDMFVIRDLKVIGGAKGSFVAMPSRKLTDRCPRCQAKNALRCRYCGQCGLRLNENRGYPDDDGRIRLHADVAHPINAPCRDRIHAAVMDAYGRELELSRQPGYVPRYDDFDDADDRNPYETPEPEHRAPLSARRRA